MKYLPTRSLSLVFLLWALMACRDKNPVSPPPPGGRPDGFESVPQRIPVAPGQVDEASGLVDSRTIGGYLWTHEDAGSDNRLYLLSHDGREVRGYPLTGVVNRDWEDIAVGAGPKPGVSYLYVGDIGNNDANPGTTSHFIYRVPELTNPDGSFAPGDITKITYRYPDATPDAETLLLDPVTNDLFVISKELDRARLYRLPYPHPGGGVLTAELVGNVPGVLLATGGDIAADGQEIVVRTYTNVYYWQRKAGETVGQTLTREFLKALPYELEPQGEAVCFDREMKGYYTFSERRTANAVTLNYYKRK